MSRQIVENNDHYKKNMSTIRAKYEDFEVGLNTYGKIVAQKVYSEQLHEYQELKRIN